MSDDDAARDTPLPAPGDAAENIDFAGLSDGSVDDVGEAIDEARGRIFPCEGCGADLRFHIGAQSLKCPYCGFVKAIEIVGEGDVEEQDYHAMLERVRQWHSERAESTDGEETDAQNEIR